VIIHLNALHKNLAVQNRSKWLVRDRNVLVISMPELKWIKIDQTDQTDRNRSK
jgi:hypothetical protein